MVLPPAPLAFVCAALFAGGYWLWRRDNRGAAWIGALVLSHWVLDALSHRPDVRYVPLDEARSKMGVYADALAMDQVIRSTRSRELGWNPSLHSVAGNAARLLEEWRNSRT